MIMNKFKEGNLATMLLLIIVFSVFTALIFTPVKVYADDIFKEFDVDIDGSGNVTIESEADTTGAWKTLITKYKNFIVGVSAVGAVTMVILFIIQFLKLGASAGNPKARSQALVGVLWTGISAAGLGAVALITGIFYRAI